MQAWRRHFETIRSELSALGVTVVNASRETALTAFPRMSLDAALQRLGGATEMRRCADF